MPRHHRHHAARRTHTFRAVRVGLAAAVLAVPLLLLDSAAHAHGAPTSPVSRTFACSPLGDAAGTPACVAAIAASGGVLADWDYLRLAGVRGRDRSAVPNGQLCSGGLAAFRGLDLARTDWPTTRLASGAAFTMSYVTTIPHQGTFRLHVTKDGYDPAKPLRWSDLESKPFLTVTDPPLRGGSYALTGTLPAGKSGRHVIYTIWENTDTPDTYYSCSDVVFGAPARGASPPVPGSGAAAPTAASGSGAGAAGAGSATAGARSATTVAGTEATAGTDPGAAVAPGPAQAPAGGGAGPAEESLPEQLTSSRTAIIGITVATFAAIGVGSLVYLRRRL